MWDGAAEPESFPGRCDGVCDSALRLRRPGLKRSNLQVEISLCSTEAFKAPLSVSPGPVGVTLLCTAAFVSPSPCVLPGPNAVNPSEPPELLRINIDGLLISGTLTCHVFSRHRSLFLIAQ